MAQGVDVQIGRDRYDRYDRDRGREGATVGIGPGGVTIGLRQRCRMVTTTIERGDRTITRRERRCDQHVAQHRPEDSATTAGQRTACRNLKIRRLSASTAGPVWVA
jgi:hypothetical protein